MEHKTDKHTGTSTKSFDASQKLQIRQALPATLQASPGPAPEEGKIGDDSIVIEAPEEGIQFQGLLAKVKFTNTTSTSLLNAQLTAFGAKIGIRDGKKTQKLKSEIKSGETVETDFNLKCSNRGNLKFGVKIIADNDNSAQKEVKIQIR